MQKKFIINFSIILAFTFLEGCLYGGTHGSIKSYEFSIAKAKLQSLVDKVLVCNNSLFKKDTASGYYNDGVKYITFFIFKNEYKNKYTIHFYGNQKYWDTSKISIISISYAHNKENQGGSDGNGGLNWYNYKLKSELIKPFEMEFISRINLQIDSSTHLTDR